jgi:hypothetical protein
MAIAKPTSGRKVSKKASEGPKKMAPAKKTAAAILKKDPTIVASQAAKKKATIKKSAAEGPKKSTAKPTAAQSAAAKKKAAIKKTASEGPKKSTAKPTSAQRYTALHGKPKIVEAGAAGLAGSAVKAGIAIVKRLTPAAKEAAKKAKTDAMERLTAQQKEMIKARERMNEAQVTRGYGGNPSHKQISNQSKASSAAVKEFAREKNKYDAMRTAYKAKYNK